MADIDPEKLIKAMKIRSALHNKNDNMYYSHRKFKDKLWREVCEEVYGNWGQLRPPERSEHVRELQKRWKSLRTCFARELCSQRREKLKQETGGRPLKRRKRYEYFDMMSFLINPETVERSEHNDSSDPLDNDFKDDEIVYSLNDTSQDREPVSTHSADNESSNFQQSYVYERNGTREEEILDMMREIKKDEGDDDRQFLLSLVPSLKKLNSKKKFEARIEILKVLKKITFDENESPA